MLKEPMLNKLSTCNAIAQNPLTLRANTAPYQLVHRDYFAATMTHSGGWPSLVTQPPSTAVPLVKMRRSEIGLALYLDKFLMTTKLSGTLTTNPDAQLAPGQFSFKL